MWQISNVHDPESLFVDQEFAKGKKRESALCSNKENYEDFLHLGMHMSKAASENSAQIGR